MMQQTNPNTWALAGKILAGLVAAAGVISGIIVAWRRLRREEKKEESRIYLPTLDEVKEYGRPPAAEGAMFRIGCVATVVAILIIVAWYLFLRK